jgi:hypothetical protein
MDTSDAEHLPAPDAKLGKSLGEFELGMAPSPVKTPVQGCRDLRGDHLTALIAEGESGPVTGASRSARARTVPVEITRSADKRRLVAGRK